jgi:hypothetical protein
MSLHHRRPISRAVLCGAFLAAMATLCLSPARAAEWSERPFAPPIGSRWIVTSDTVSETVKDKGTERLHTRQIVEITYDAKTDVGFHVTYVPREIVVDGNSVRADMLRSTMTVMRGITVKGTTDKRGKPVSIENLDEVKAAFRAAIARLTDKLKDKPKAAEVVNRIMSGFLAVDGQQAAKFFLGEVGTLAQWHETGLKPGEVKHDTENQRSPLGGTPIQVNIDTRIEKADATSGDVQFVRTHAYDRDALKAWTLDLLKRSGAGNVPSDAVEKVFKQLTMTNDTRTVADVKNGMTRAIDEQENLTVSAMGVTFTKHERKRTTVTPAK